MVVWDEKDNEDVCIVCSSVTHNLENATSQLCGYIEDSVHLLDQKLLHAQKDPVDDEAGGSTAELIISLLPSGRHNPKRFRLSIMRDIMTVERLATK